MAALLRLSFAILVVWLLLITIDVAMVEGRTCQRRSKTWTGLCGVSSHCDNQCRRWEHAAHGACHYDFPGFACFCYFNC
ncbi:Defensin-like protein 19 [Striga hermonthica]|uniref:Defensin-like protein 19 n=1 Tax=Striga hermonthica TaxID=68872 RepID=A0A9N7MZF3_STRHE|nr:Defensin-like protein 19 [Striga hermonthica]